MKNRFKKLMVSLGLAIGVIAPSLSVQKSVAQQKSENVIWVNPMDRWEMAWASNLADSVMSLIEQEDIPVVFIEIPPMAGSLCNRFILGDKAADSVWLENCTGGSVVPFEGEENFVNLLQRLKRYNEGRKQKVQLWGYDISSGPGSWMDELRKIPDYNATTIADSLIRYCLDEEINKYEQAARTSKMMQKEKKRFKRLLGEEYDPWLRFVQAQSNEGIVCYDDRYHPDALAALIAEDYLWLDKRVKGRKIVICSRNVGQKILALKKR